MSVAAAVALLPGLALVAAVVGVIVEGDGDSVPGSETFVWGEGVVTCGCYRNAYPFDPQWLNLTAVWKQTLRNDGGPIQIPPRCL